MARRVAQLSAIDTESLIAAVEAAGYAIIKIGDVPAWMERVDFPHHGHVVPRYRVKGHP